MSFTERKNASWAVAVAVVSMMATFATGPVAGAQTSADPLPGLPGLPALPDVTGRAGKLVPQPASVEPLDGSGFSLNRRTRVVVRPGSARAVQVGRYLAWRLRCSTGYPVPVRVTGSRATNAIVLNAGGRRGLGAEGYALVSKPAAVMLAAYRPQGLFRGVQTLRQLLPPKVESSTVRPGPWGVPAVKIGDAPRFGYRGVMLDVARHFFSVREVKRYIDLASMYKINRLHLHLTDDQGWRVAIGSWPRLATYGGGTEIGGGPGGYYPKRQYAEIVRYAAARYMTVVPEIDSPGHINAALASYAKLNCDGSAPPRYTGTAVGFSSLCIRKTITYRFLNDIWRELADLTPGPLAHIGGDEAHATDQAAYLKFLGRAFPIIGSHHKRLMGWQEIAAGPLPKGALTQYWGYGDPASDDLARLAVAKGAKVVMSPANRAYLDMKYDPTTPYGLNWAGYVPVSWSYSWDPTLQVKGVGEADVAGVEAPLWTETIDDMDKAEFMSYPRLPGIAEIGWSPRVPRNWVEYSTRLAGQGPRWDILDVNYYHAPDVPWVLSTGTTTSSAEVLT